MQLRKGTLVRHVEATGHNSHTGQVMMARHTADSYIVRWTAQLQNGETKTWIQEHSRLALRPAI